jgi:hypothetical protein
MPTLTALGTSVAGGLQFIPAAQPNKFGFVRHAQIYSRLANERKGEATGRSDHENTNILERLLPGERDAYCRAAANF